MNWEYRVVPAPDRAGRQRGVKGAEAKFARTIEDVINHMAASGWEYCRAEMLPETARRRSTTYHNLLIFRRDPENAPEEEVTPLLEAPARSSSGYAPAKPGLAKRLGSGAGRLMDVIMARTSRTEKNREEPLFQHEALKGAAEEAPAETAETSAETSTEASGEKRD